MQMKFINKRHFIVLVAVFSMASLTGCKEAPQPEEAEGIPVAAVETARETEPEPTQELETEGKQETEIRESLSANGVEVPVQVTLEEQPDQMLKAKISYQDMDTEKLLKILFPSNTQETLHYLPMETNGSGDAGDSYLKEYPPETGTWEVLDDSTGKALEGLTITREGIISYINYGLNDKHPIRTQVSSKEFGETDAPNTSLSLQDALDQLQLFLASMDAPEVQVLSCKAYQDDYEKGYYQIEFMPKFHSFDFSENLPTMSGSSLINLFGRAVIAEEGVMEVTGNFLFACTEEQEIGILTARETLGKLKEHMELGRIVLPEGSAISGMKLKYLTSSDGMGLQAFPAWVLQISNQKLEGTEEDYLMVHEIGLMAENGEIAYMY